MTRITLAILLVALAAPASHGETLFRFDRLSVHDAEGRLVGTVAAPNIATFLPAMAAARVAFRTDTGRLVSVVVTSKQLFGDGELYFESADCSGPPLITRSNGVVDDLFTASAVVGPRRTVYVQSGRFRSAVARSGWDSAGACVGDVFFDQPLAPATAAGVDLADYFTPPFRLRAQAGDAVPKRASTDAPLVLTDGLVVFDANGKRLGATDHGVFVSTAFVTGSGRIVPIRVQEDGILTDEVYFESADCSGTPFLEGSDGALARLTAVLGPRRTVHARNGAERTRRMYSRGQPGGPCVSGLPDGWSVSAVPLVSLDLDLADYFTPPFAVRAGRGTRPLGSLD